MDKKNLIIKLFKSLRGEKEQTKHYSFEGGFRPKKVAKTLTISLKELYNFIFYSRLLKLSYHSFILYLEFLIQKESSLCVVETFNYESVNFSPFYS